VDVAEKEAREKRSLTEATARGAVACRHFHLNHDLARMLRARPQIAILDKSSIRRNAFKFGISLSRNARSEIPN